jgi:hypothetical protein
MEFVENLGFEETDGVYEQTFDDAHEAATALVNLKSQFFGQGYKVDGEYIEEGAVVCEFIKDDGEPVVVTQYVDDLTVTVE